MNKTTTLLSISLIALTAASAGSALAAPPADKILEFDTMTGLPPAYTGTTNAVRSVPGGGLPWSIASARGELRTDGKLEIDVTGLVFAAGPNTGSNTVPNFRAIVSCLSVDGTGNASTVNVGTGNFPASAAGNAYIEATVQLPSPCIAPIIFVTSPGGAWFAATGF